MESIEKYLLVLLLISPVLIIIPIAMRARRDKHFLKRCLQVLFIVIILFGLFCLNSYSLSPSALLYNMGFYIQNGRMMTAEESIMYEKFGDDRLVDSAYCKEIGGQWTYGLYHNKPCEYMFSERYCFDYCMPPASDAGKVCYDDSECEGYCDVKSADTIYGNCSSYKAKRDECAGYYYFMNGEVRRSLPLWC